MGGGVVWERARLGEVVAAARQLGMATHLDGARLWNAAAATGASERELATGFDSVSVCMSKGLGAPVGSPVAGARALVPRCHHFRNVHRRGVRPAGGLPPATRPPAH